VWVCILSCPACKACSILCHHLWPAHIYHIIPCYLINSIIFGKKGTEHEMCALTFSTVLSETLIILQIIQQDIITIYVCSHVQYPLYLSHFNDINFLDRLPEYSQISNFMKIHPVGASCCM
jgi:hypothetical protein